MSSSLSLLVMSDITQMAQAPQNLPAQHWAHPETLRDPTTGEMLGGHKNTEARGWQIPVLLSSRCSSTSAGA